MRNVVLSLLIMLLTLSCLAQDSLLSKKPLKTSYSKRIKDQRTGGFVLCGAGLAGLLTTAIADGGQRAGGAFVTIISLGTYEPDYKSYTGAYLVSAASFIGGIYLYSASSKNKRKATAASVTIGMENIEVLKDHAIYKLSFPTVGLRIKI